MRRPRSRRRLPRASQPPRRRAMPRPSRKKPAAKPAPKRLERPLPAFSGWTLDDHRFEVSKLLGRRLLLFFFNPEVRDAELVAHAIAGIAPLAGKNNFQIVGIATGSSRARAAAFAKQTGLDFPIVDDSSAAIAQQLGLRVPVALLGADAEGYVTFGVGQFAGRPSPMRRSRSRAQLREAMRLPTRGDSVEPTPRHAAARAQLPGADARREPDLRPRGPARQARDPALLPAHLSALPRAARLPEGIPARACPRTSGRR